MNGTISFRHDPGDDFTPSARRNSANPLLVYVTLSEQTEILSDSADECRRYAAAFTEAARLLDTTGDGAS